MPLAEERDACLRCPLAYPCSLNLEPGIYRRLLKTPSPDGRSLSDDEADVEVLILLSVISIFSELNWVYAMLVTWRYNGLPPLFVLRLAVGTSREDELTSSTGGSKIEATFH